MDARALVYLTLACCLSGCSNGPKSPTEPGVPGNSLTVEQASVFINAGDFRIYSVRLRVRETAGSPITIAQVALQFLGESVAATRTFSTIAKGQIAANSSVELDDLIVMDEPHQLDAAKTISATVTYRNQSGETWTATAHTAVPNCANTFDVWGPALIGVGQSAQLSAGLETCPPMFYPLSGSQVQWRSLTPDLASVDDRGRVTALGRGLASIEGTYGHMRSTHTVTVGP